MNKLLLVITVVMNALYLSWLAPHVNGVAGFVFYIAEFSVSALSFLFLINHWSQKHTLHSHREPSGSVDIFIPIVDEPLSIVEPVLRSASRIEYDQKRVWVLDDGKRTSLASLAKQYGAEYVSRPDARADNKAGNLNYALLRSRGDYILVLDADQEVTNPRILQDLLGHFAADKKLAMVATRQRFNVPHADFNHDVLFYEHMQTGKNDNNAAISSGSGVIYARVALKRIGGFQTWSIVEDLYTAYVLHQHGYRTLYINKAYTIGTAPMDLSAIYKQRGTWALDTLRMFFKDNPIFKKTLGVRQKLHYLELSFAYLASAFGIQILFLLPPISLLFNIELIDASREYVAFRVPSLLSTLILYRRLSGNTFSTSQFWAGLSPVYLWATILALLPGKPKYKVTPKIHAHKRDTALILPQLFTIIFALSISFFYFMRFGFNSLLSVNLIWIMLMFFWYWPVIYKGLLKE